MIDTTVLARLSKKREAKLLEWAEESLGDFAQLIGLFTEQELRSMRWSEIAQVAELYARFFECGRE